MNLHLIIGLVVMSAAIYLVLYIVADLIAYGIAGYRWYKSNRPWSDWTELSLVERMRPGGGFAQLRRFPKTPLDTDDSSLHHSDS